MHPQTTVNLSVAQLVEQLTLNQRVIGSSPIGETPSQSEIPSGWLFYLLMNRTLENLFQKLWGGWDYLGFKDSRIQDSRIQERVVYTLYKEGDKQCNIKNRYQSSYTIEKESR